MRKKRFYGISCLSYLNGVMVFFTMLITGSSCNNTSSNNDSAVQATANDTLNNWLSWHLVFKAGVNNQTQQQDFEEVQTYIAGYLDSLNNSNPNKKYHYKAFNWRNDQTGDSLHHQFSADLGYNAADSITPPAPVHDGPKLTNDTQ
jgi:hypothetical protein